MSGQRLKVISDILQMLANSNVDAWQLMLQVSVLLHNRLRAQGLLVLVPQPQGLPVLQ